MRHHNDTLDRSLHPELAATVSRLRTTRNFEPGTYLAEKAELLNSYLRHHKLGGCVIGVSGGIDSAVVLGIVAAAAAAGGSPIERVVPVLLPVHDPSGATNQHEAVTRGREVVDTFGLEAACIDLTGPHAALVAAVEHALGRTAGGWARGQAVSYARTPALYTATSLLAEADVASIVCGTTNLDEGAYLGYFGKASDGMVDVQLIADLHKSDVRALAVHLGVPASITGATPSGDMFDGRADEDVFGAPYDFVEIYLQWLTRNDDARAELRSSWSPDASDQFDLYAKNLEALHDFNSHKYLVASPAVHLDLRDVAVPHGWDFRTWSPPVLVDESADDSATPGSRRRFVNAFAPAPNTLSALAIGAGEAVGTLEARGDIDPAAAVVHDLLDARARRALVADLDERLWVPVGYDGHAGRFDGRYDEVGSWRASAYSDEAAASLWDRIAPHVRALWDDPVWEPIGINPLLRFIRYDNGGQLVAHYDAPYVFHARERTALSVVVYLDTADVSGGQTRFLLDPQAALPERERRYDDWTRPGKPEEVRAAVQPAPGDAVMFPHRLLHDSEPAIGAGRKIIMRTDVIVRRAAAA